MEIWLFQMLRYIFMITVISRKIRRGYRIMKHTVCEYNFSDYNQSVLVRAVRGQAGACWGWRAVYYFLRCMMRKETQRIAVLIVANIFTYSAYLYYNVLHCTMSHMFLPIYKEAECTWTWITKQLFLVSFLYKCKKKTVLYLSQVWFSVLHTSIPARCLFQRLLY